MTVIAVVQTPLLQFCRCWSFSVLTAPACTDAPRTPTPAYRAGADALRTTPGHETVLHQIAKIAEGHSHHGWRTLLTRQRSAVANFTVKELAPFFAGRIAATTWADLSDWLSVECAVASGVTVRALAVHGILDGVEQHRVMLACAVLTNAMGLTSDQAQAAAQTALATAQLEAHPLPPLDRYAQDLTDAQLCRTDSQEVNLTAVPLDWMGLLECDVGLRMWLGYNTSATMYALISSGLQCLGAIPRHGGLQLWGELLVEIHRQLEVFPLVHEPLLTSVLVLLKYEYGLKLDSAFWESLLEATRTTRLDNSLPSLATSARNLAVRVVSGSSCQL